MRGRRIVVSLGAVGLCAFTVGAAVAPGRPATERRSLSAADMTGKKEVSPEGRRGVGDPNGFGSFTAIGASGNRLCYGMTVRSVDQPVAAHIHRGGPNVAGPILIPLQAPATGDAGAISGCVTADASLLRAIFKNPARYYVNIHTSAFPGGAVRSQLAKR